MPTSNFAIYYQVKDQAFLRAAKTWKSGLNDGNPCELIGVSYIYELVSAFKRLASTAKAEGLRYRRGAMFIHSTPPVEGQPDTSVSRGIHTRPLQPTTLAELRYKEEVLTPAGLNIDTASLALIKQLAPLPWTDDGQLWVYSCLSGESAPGKKSIAQVLADGQRVRTYGQLGKAYFSSSYGEYKKISPADTSIYLRSYMRKMNIAVTLLGGGAVVMPGTAMSEQEFRPENP